MPLNIYSALKQQDFTVQLYICITLQTFETTHIEGEGSFSFLVFFNASAFKFPVRQPVIWVITSLCYK